MIFISNWIYGGSRGLFLIDGESNGEEVGGFWGGSRARMGIIFNKDPCAPRRIYGASSFSFSFLAFQSPPGLHIRDVYISINKTRVQRASLEVSPLISITRQFLCGQLTHIYIDRRDTDEAYNCKSSSTVIERLFFFSRNKEQSNTRFVRHSKKRGSCRKYRACHCRPSLREHRQTSQFSKG